MTLGDVAQLITAMSAFGALVLSYFNRRAINEVHISTNSRMDQLLEMNKKSSRAEGLKEGREEMQR
jgi:hypothetical protein